MAIKEKEILVKVYDPTRTTFLATVTNIKARPNFRNKINDAYGQATLFLDDDFDAIPSYIQLTNVVDISAVDEDSPSGRLVYRGFISQVKPRLKGSQGEVEITLRGIGDLLRNSYYKDGASFDVTKTSLDPAEIFREIIDQFNSVYPGNLIRYTASSIDTVGIDVTYTYQKKKWFDALRDTFSLVASGWYWFINQDGTVFLKRFPTQATHTFTVERDVDSVEPNETVEKVINKSTTIYSSGTATVQNIPSQITYGVRETVIEDSNITDATTAAQRADNEIVKDPKITGRVRVNNFFEIETVKVGDTIRLRNFDNTGSILGENMPIVSVSYEWDFITLDIGENRDDFAEKLTKFVN